MPSILTDRLVVEILRPEDMIELFQTSSKSVDIKLYDLGDSALIRQRQVTESRDSAAPFAVRVLGDSFDYWVSFNLKYGPPIGGEEEHKLFECSWSEQIQPLQQGDKIFFYHREDLKVPVRVLEIGRSM